MPPVPPHALSDLKVLDLSRALAGPSCTWLLAEMGAEVVKVETPAGDLVRALSVYREGRSLFYVQWNRGKKSLCVDLRDARGIELVTRLVPRADVVVENFRPGVLERMGLGYEKLRALNPGVVLCSISALGREGPLAERPGYDYVAQAYSGITSMIGEPDAPPVIPGVSLGDISTGAYGALAILAALRHRDRTGRGQHVSVSLLDVYYNYHEANVHMVSGSDGEIEPTRNGRFMGYVCPAGVFRTPGGPIVLIGGIHHWPDLARAIERPELATDPDWQSESDRLARLEELVIAIEASLARFPDRDAVIAHLEAHGVPAAPVLSVTETLEHPHLRERGTVRTVHDPVHGTLEVPGMPLRFSEFPEPLPLVAPTLGQHNAEILDDWLGCPRGEVEALRAAGVLQERDV